MTTPNPVQSIASVISVVGDPQTPVFVDTSGWADPILQNTANHEAMLACYRELMGRQQRLVTSNYILTEAVALIGSRVHGTHSLTRPELLQYIEDIQALSWVEVADIDLALHQEAWRLLREAPDKSWSWVDASSFVLMRRLGITFAFTSDRHFVQAGFVRLPIQP